MNAKTSVESYEVLYTRLEDVVARLEAGDLTLDESLRLYEEGVELAATCQQMLDAAELHIEQIQASFQTGMWLENDDGSDGSDDSDDSNYG